MTRLPHCGHTFSGIRTPSLRGYLLNSPRSMLFGKFNKGILDIPVMLCFSQQNSACFRINNGYVFCWFDICRYPGMDSLIFYRKQRQLISVWGKRLNINVFGWPMCRKRNPKLKPNQNDSARQERGAKQDDLYQLFTVHTSTLPFSTTELALRSKPTSTGETITATTIAPAIIDPRTFTHPCSNQ